MPPRLLVQLTSVAQDAWLERLVALPLRFRSGPAR